MFNTNEILDNAKKGFDTVSKEALDFGEKFAKKSVEVIVPSIVEGIVIGLVVNGIKKNKEA